MSDNLPARRKASDLARIGKPGRPRTIAARSIDGPARRTTSDLARTDQQDAAQCDDVVPVRPTPVRSREATTSTSRSFDSGSFSVEHISVEHLTINVYNESHDTNVDQTQLIGYPSDDVIGMHHDVGGHRYWIRSPRLSRPRRVNILGTLTALGIVALLFVGAVAVVSLVVRALTPSSPSVTIHQHAERPKSFSDYLREQDRH
jgi:hypothetical protein